MEEWHPFGYKLSVIGTDTTRHNLSMPQMAEQFEHIIENVALEDVTTAFTYARLFVTNGVTESFHREWRTLSAGTLYYDNTITLRLKPEEIAGIGFFGITSGDLLHVYIRGKRRKLS